MKFPNFLMNKSFSARALVLLAGLFLMAFTVPAQKVPEANPNPGLEQCRNGGPSSPQQCIGNAWVTGNANSTQSHYAETQYLPYRFTITSAAIGTTYTVTIGYDIIKVNGSQLAHAIDFLGTFNNTESNADPCSDLIVGCNPASPDTTLLIPPDTQSVLPSIVQPPAHFAIWGATPVGSATYNTYTSGDTHRSITLTFTTTAANVVIAWSGHVAWAGDWGAGNSAGGISGSPYHTNIDSCSANLNGCGALDVQLSASAVTPAGVVRVIKVAQDFPVGGNPPTGTAVTAFPFTASSLFGTPSFSLVDNVPGPTGVSRDSAAIASFGPSNTVTVTEQNTFGWTLADLTCTPNIAGSVVSTSKPVQPAAFAGQAVVYVNPGGLVTCTFTNSQLGITAAPANITGQVFTSTGMPIRGVSIVLTNLSTGETRTATTNTFGFYTFTGLTTEDLYRMTPVSTKRYQFDSTPRMFTLMEDLAGLDFFANN